MEGAGRYHDQRGWALGKQQRTQRMDHLYLDLRCQPWACLLRCFIRCTSHANRQRSEPTDMSVALSGACGLEQEPAPSLCLIDPGLE